MEGGGVSTPAPLGCFGDLSAGVLCSQILKSLHPKTSPGLEETTDEGVTFSQRFKMVCFETELRNHRAASWGSARQEMLLPHL